MSEALPCDRSDVHPAHSWDKGYKRCPGVIQRIPTRAEWQAWLDARATPPEGTR